MNELVTRAPKILLVEDDLVTQRLLKKYLEDDGYEVTIASDGVDALMCLGGKCFDLIISDIMMDSMSGFRLLECMKIKKIPTPLIFITSDDQRETEIYGLMLGADDFIKKPIRKEVFLQRINNTLHEN
jgi:DNA-binding response OmpR family regulator